MKVFLTETVKFWLAEIMLFTLVLLLSTLILTGHVLLGGYSSVAQGYLTIAIYVMPGSLIVAVLMAWRVAWQGKKYRLHESQVGALEKGVMGEVCEEVN